MQHLWIHHRHNNCSFKTYQDFIERIKLTPRKWNSNSNINQTLKYLTWALGTSINLIKFKHKKNNQKNNFLCPHTSLCYIPCYQFHNPFIKLKQKNHSEFYQVNLLEFQSVYYSIPSNSCYPILINKAPNFNFDTISKSDICNILQGNKIEKNFMVGLYSTPSYVRTQYTNIISQNLIGILQNNSTTILHLFITPHLNGTDFDVYQLEIFNQLDHTSFHLINHLSCTRPTEGDPIFKSSERPNTKLLNQDNCVCEHPDTARYFAPTNKAFKSLGEYKYYILSTSLHT